MTCLFPGSFGLPEESNSPAQATAIDETPILSSIGAMYSTLLQFRSHVETEKLERTTLKQMVQRHQRDFALLRPQIESLDQPATSKSPLVKLEKEIKVLEKRLSTETCRYNSRLNSLQHQLSTMGDQICQFAATGTWASISISISAGEYDDILPWPVSKTIQNKVRDQLNPLNTWSQIIKSKKLTKPTADEYSTVPTIRYTYFFPHSKHFNETDGYLHNDTIYIKISFSDPPVLPTQSPLLFLFP